MNSRIMLKRTTAFHFQFHSKHNPQTFLFAFSDFHKDICLINVLHINLADTNSKQLINKKSYSVCNIFLQNSFLSRWRDLGSLEVFFFSFFFRICRLLKEVLLKEYSEEKKLSYKVELYHSFIYNNGMKRHENPEKNSSDHHIYPRWFRILYAH